MHSQSKFRRAMVTERIGSSVFEEGQNRSFRKPLLDQLTTDFRFLYVKLKHEDLENIKTNCINTVFFSLHFGTHGILMSYYLIL